MIGDEIQRKMTVLTQRPHILPCPHRRIDCQRIRNIESAVFVWGDINWKKMHSQIGEDRLMKLLAEKFGEGLQG